MDEDQEDVFQEYTTTTPNKCWASFRGVIEKIITNPTYHKIFLLLVVVDTALVYTEERSNEKYSQNKVCFVGENVTLNFIQPIKKLLIGMMAENLNTCDCYTLGQMGCPDVDWCDATIDNLPEIPNNSTSTLSSTTTTTTTTSITVPTTALDTSQCCKYQRLLQTWIRMGYTTFGLLSLFFIETTVKLVALPHLLSRKMEIADAMLGNSN